MTAFDAFDDNEAIWQRMKARLNGSVLPDGAPPFESEHDDDSVDRLYRDRAYRREQLGLNRGPSATNGRR